MKDRIKLIMEKENLTPAKFADKLQINRAIISHILNGRNNPSLDVVSKILSEMNYINAEWLINGTGEMYRQGYTEKKTLFKPSLFNQDDANMTKSSHISEESKEISLKQIDKQGQSIDNNDNKSSKSIPRKITQIIIYFDDNTFEIFNPPIK